MASIYQYFIDEADRTKRTHAIVWSIKEALLASGWTVFGSGTGNSGSYGSSDLWTSTNGTNLNYGAYIILTDPTNTTQVQIGLYNDVTYGEYRISFSFSADKSFAVPSAADDFTATTRVISSPKDSTEASTYTNVLDLPTANNPGKLIVWTAGTNGSPDEDNLIFVYAETNRAGKPVLAVGGYCHLENSYASDTAPYVIWNNSNASTSVMQNTKDAYSPFYTGNFQITPQTLSATQINATVLWWTNPGVTSGSIWSPSYAKFGDNVTHTWPEESIQVMTDDSSEYRHRGNLPNELIRFVSNDTWNNWTPNESYSRIIVGGFSLPWSSNLELI